MQQFTINVVGGVTVSQTALSITEGDGATPVTETYTVALASRPSGTVRVTPSVDPDSCDNCGVSIATSALTFTTSNWSTPQTVTVNVASDDGDSDDETATITHTVTGANYVNVPVTSVAVTVMDNDSPGVRVLNASGSSITTITVAEGATTNNTYQVRLNTAPTSNVTVTLAKASGDSADITFSPTTALTFRPGAAQPGDPATSTRWDDPQTITIGAAQDGDAVNDTATITHTTNVASGGDSNYASTAGISAAQARNRIEFLGTSPSRAGSCIGVAELWRPCDSSWRRPRGYSKRLQFYGKASRVGKLHEAVVKVKIGRFHGHFMILLKRGSERAKCVCRGYHHECTHSASSNPSKPLPIRLSGPWNSCVEPDSKMRDVYTQFEGSSGYDTPQTPGLEPLFNSLAIFGIIAGTVRQNIRIAGQLLQFHCF